MFDQDAPHALIVLQQWFGSTITYANKSPGLVDRWIKPSLTLEASERMELYIQQYLWRLIKILQENFPTLLRLFGPQDFNEQLAEPFIRACPPTHWSLAFFGQTMSSWLDTHYHKEDKVLVVAAAAIDSLCLELFLAKTLPPLSSSIASNHLSFEALADRALVHQPFVRVVDFPFGLPSFRKALLAEEPEFWLDHPFPALDKGGAFRYIFYRNQANKVCWVQIEEKEATFFRLFETPKTLDEAFLAADQTVGFNGYENLLVEWFHRYAKFNWITLGKS